MTPTSRTQVPATPAREQDHQVEQEIIIEILRGADNERLPCAELERWLARVDPLALGDALERLQQRKILRLDGETIRGRAVARGRQKLTCSCPSWSTSW